MVEIFRREPLMCRIWIIAVADVIFVGNSEEDHGKLPESPGIPITPARLWGMPRQVPYRVYRSTAWLALRGYHARDTDLMASAGRVSAAAFME